jgi:SAM-dependent methyltransferase
VTLAQRISAVSRAKKMRLFMELMRPDPETTIVDVGVDHLGSGDAHQWPTANFFEELYPWRGQITAVGTEEGALFRRRYPNIPYVQADGCDLPFADGQFDACFSNAVLEHVGDRERQRQFVAEALRVARRVLITTPNRLFPVELHTRFPFVHWLPKSIAGRIYTLGGKAWARELDLLRPREFVGLFPAGSWVRLVNLGLTLAVYAERPDYHGGST